MFRLTGWCFLCSPRPPFASSANSCRRLVPSGRWGAPGEPVPTPGGSKRFEAFLRAADPFRLRALDRLKSASALSAEAGSGQDETPYRLHSSLPMTARLSLHLRFARLCPKTLRGVFSDAAAGIAATSSGLNFPFSFRTLIPKKSVEFFLFDEWRLRLESESRKRNLWILSTACRICGGQPVGCLLTN